MTEPKACPECSAEISAKSRFCPECGAALGGARSLEGRTLAGKYEIQRRIGEGSMGQIYLAMHLGLEKRVAIKVLHRDVELGPEASQRFRREGIAAGRIRHRNAIEVFDLDTTEDGLTFLAMEFVEGRDLRQALDQDGPMGFDDASAVILQVLAALRAAHSLEIVHRDLKPANIMLADEGGRLRVKVLDFGLSKLVSRKIEASLTTIPGRIIGTPLYMAPEQSSGEEADARADLYAIGLIFFELLTGERPFQGKTLTELLYAQATEPVPLVSERLDDPDLPEHMDAFFQKALHRDKDLRFQSAEEMVAALLGDEAVEAPEDDRPRREPARAARRGGRRGDAGGNRKLLIGAGVGLAAVMALVIAFALSTTSGGATDDAPRLRARSAAARPEGAKDYLARLDTARVQLAGGDARGALAAANAAFALPLRDPEAFLVRGLAHRASGDPAAAVRDLEQALSDDDAFQEARVELGWTFLALGEGDEARSRFEAALADARGRDLANAHAGLGTLAVQRGEAGDEDFQRAIAADAECWRAHAGRGRAAIARRDGAAAVAAYAEAKRWRPSDATVLVGLGDAHLLAGEDEDALSAYEDALEVADDDPAAALGLAAASLRTGRDGSARGALDRLAGQVDGLRAARLLGLVSSLRADDRAAVRGALGELDRNDPDRAMLFELRAALENLDGDHEAAQASADRALRVDAGRAGAHHQRAVALFRQGRYTDSALALTEALKLAPRWPEPYLLLGVLEMDYLVPGQPLEGAPDAAPRPDLAREHLIRYVELGGADGRAEDWIVELEEAGR